VINSIGVRVIKFIIRRSKSVCALRLLSQTGVTVRRCPLQYMWPLLLVEYNKNLAIANRSRVSCAHNTYGASRPIVTP